MQVCVYVLWCEEGESVMAEPNRKHPAIEELLTKLIGKDRVKTIQADLCMFCGQEATGFRDALSRKEYSISGLCQECQDKEEG